MRPRIPRTTRAALAAASVFVLAACGTADGTANGQGTSSTSAPSSTSGPSSTSAPAPAQGAIASAGSVEIRPVALAAPAADAAETLLKGEETLDDMLVDLGLGGAEGASEAATWFTDADCAGTPVATADAAAGCSGDGSRVYLMGSVALDASHVAEVEHVEGDETGDSVELALTEEGTRALAELTETTLAKAAPANQIAITVDGSVLTAVTVKSAITNGQVSIIGGSDNEGLLELSQALD